MTRSASPLWQAAALGAAAGLAALLLDDLLAVVMLGYWIPLSPQFPLAYLLAGVVSGLLLLLITRLVRHRSEKAIPGLLVTGSLAVLYLPSLLERVHQSLELRLPLAAVVLVQMLTMIGYGIWIVLLLRLVPEPHRWWPLLATCLTVALLLAVNRNLVDLPTAPLTLALDLLILATGSALALLVRLVRPRYAVALVLVAVTAAAGYTVASRDLDPGGLAPARGTHPNLLLVVIDTLRYDVFQSVLAGTEEGQALHDMLHDAAWFSNATAASPWTSPSIGSIMTGLYPPEHGFGRRVRDLGRPLLPLADEVPTLAEGLASQGYLTAGIVANPLLHPHSGIGRGFAHYEVLSVATSKLPLLTVLVRLGLSWNRLYQQAGPVGKLFERRLATVLRNRRTGGQRPFFIWLHLMDPHAPLNPQEGLANGGGDELPELDLLYRNEVRYVSRELAAMLALLRSHGVWDETVVVLVSDHGEMFPSDRHTSLLYRDGEPVQYGHGHALYEELVRVPLAIRPPGGLPGGRQVDVLASHVDLYDTLIDLLGVELTPIGRDRTSLAPWLAVQPPTALVPGRGATLICGIQRGPQQRALRTGRVKLIHAVNGEHPDELYYLRSDPGELQDLASRQAQQARKLGWQLSVLWHRITPIAAREVPVDPQAEQRLRALGYVE